MNSLLLLALFWLPLALATDIAVRAVSDPFTSFPKKALFYLVTLPLVWLRVLENQAHRVSNLPFVSKIAKWFKE